MPDQASKQRYYLHMIVYLSLLMALAGMLAYALSSNGKIAELGRLAFAVGLLAFLLTFSGTMKVLP